MSLIVGNRRPNRLSLFIGAFPQNRSSSKFFNEDIIEMAKHNQLRRRNTEKPGLNFESLESKKLLAGISYDTNTGIVTIDGSSKADYVQIQQSAPQEISVVFSYVETKSFSAASVSEIVFNGRDGNDWFKNDTATSTRAYGQNGDDTLVGGAGVDRLRGGAGVDRLVGQAGKDFVNGDVGDDRIFGGSGDDKLLGGSGNDFVSGQDGSDTVIGNDGDDVLNGGEGNDVIDGSYGNDSISGDAGDDVLNGSAGDDEISGLDGRDLLFGGLGRDELFGGGGIDDLDGGEDNDLIAGGDGDDFLFGKGEADMLYGNGGHDRIYGGTGADLIRGGTGADDLFGEDGEDDLDGQNGNDDLDGGSGVDHVRGGTGNDDYIQDRDDDLNDDSEDYDEAGDFEIAGNISNLDEMAKTFTLNGLTIDYSQARIEGTLANDAFFKVEGTLNGNIVLADEVEADSSEREDNFEARGTVAGLDETNKTFTFLGFIVDYSKSEVEGDLIDGAKVIVVGAFDGTIIFASEIELDD